jgi:ABC-type uncharacterized transport system involved in gliding motility auxiliary subunit
VFGGVEDLDEWALYRIDRFIQLGGKVLFAVKGIYIDTLYGSIEARYQNDQGLLDMIASYGAIVRAELVLDRNALTLQFQTRTQSGGFQYRIVRYPLWIGIPEEFGNTEHPVSSGFSGLDLYWSSPLELVPVENVQAEALFTSSAQAWLMRESFYTSPEILYLMEVEAADTRGTKILGASLSGNFPSFFGKNFKPVREGSQEELPDMPRITASSRIIVIGDTDFATNMINATQAVHNLEFLVRAADWLSSDDDIVVIRNRQPQAGRSDRIQDIDRRAAAMKFSQILNVAIIPILVIIGGFAISSQRKKRSRYVQTAREESSDV